MVNVEILMEISWFFILWVSVMLGIFATLSISAFLMNGFRLRGVANFWCSKGENSREIKAGILIVAPLVIAFFLK